MLLSLTMSAPTQVITATNGGWRQPLPIDWQACRKAYESGVNVVTLAGQFNVKADAIYQRIHRQGWLKPKQQNDLHALRPLLKGKLKDVIDKLPGLPKSPNIKRVKEHADTLSVLSSTASLVEGWDTQGDSRAVTVESMQVVITPGWDQPEQVQQPEQVIDVAQVDPPAGDQDEPVSE